MVTKRQLGLGLLFLGVGGVIVLLALDFLGGGRFQGIGPTQRLAMAGAALVALLGASLIPLGDRPA
jgi:hypothetical protein